MNMIEKRRRMRGQGGFTLIELLVVIAILAVLAGVVVFAVNGITSSSQETACKTEARTVKTAVQAYFAENEAYPGGADQAAALAVLTGPNGFLEDAPTGVAITFDLANTANAPVYAWDGTTCTAANTGQATP